MRALIYKTHPPRMPSLPIMLTRNRMHVLLAVVKECLGYLKIVCTASH